MSLDVNSGKVPLTESQERLRERINFSKEQEAHAMQVVQNPNNLVLAEVFLYSAERATEHESRISFLSTCKIFLQGAIQTVNGCNAIGIVAPVNTRKRIEDIVAAIERLCLPSNPDIREKLAKLLSTYLNPQNTDFSAETIISMGQALDKHGIYPLRNLLIMDLKEMQAYLNSLNSHLQTSQPPNAPEGSTQES